MQQVAAEWIGSPEWRELGRERLREALDARDLRRAFLIAGMLRVGADLTAEWGTTTAGKLRRLLRIAVRRPTRIAVRVAQLQLSRPRERRPTRRSSSARSPGRLADDDPEPDLVEHFPATGTGAVTRDRVCGVLRVDNTGSAGRSGSRAPSRQTANDARPAAASSSDPRRR